MQASLSITNSWRLLKLMSIESVMPSNHLILCPPLLLQPWIFPSISVFSNESVLCSRWPMYWSFSFSINPSSEYSRLISVRMDWLDLRAVQGILIKDWQNARPIDFKSRSVVTHSSTLARRIPWMEEPGGLQSMGSQRLGHD